MKRKFRGLTIPGDAYDDVDATDPRPGGWLGKPAENDRIAWYVFQAPNVFKVEMMVPGRVGIEIGFAGIDDHFVKQANLHELMQGVVNGRQRDPNARVDRVGVKRLCGHVTMRVPKKKAGQGEPLPGGPQTNLLEAP